MVGYQGQRLVLAAEARDATLILRPGTSWEHANDDGALVLTMPAAAAIRLGDVPEERVGTYQIDELPGLTIAVQETVVTDQDGNEVGRIG